MVPVPACVEAGLQLAMALGILDGSQIICPYCSMEEGAGSLLLSRRLARAFVSAQPIAVRRG